MRSIVIVGGGQAGGTVVSRLRALGCKDKLSIYCNEAIPPYERPPLSKSYLLGDSSREDLLLRPASFYAEQNIELHLETKIEAINRNKKTLQAGTKTIPYDDLVLATGASAILLPESVGGTLDGVYPVRTVADVDSIATEFAQGRHLLVIGGGYVGLEAAAVARKLGLDVTVVELSDRILKRVASQQTSDFIRDLHTSHGVVIREGTSVKCLEGGKRVERAVLSDDSTLEVDFALVGIGIRPNIHLANEAGLEIDNGIKTNAYGKTSDLSIFAAGDCASLPYKMERIRLESVQNATDQAVCVAQNLMGKNMSYTPMPWFWSEQYGLRLQMVGLNTGYDTVIERRSDRATSFWYYSHGNLISVDAMGDPRAYMVAKRLLEEGRSADPTLVANSNINLKTLL